MRAINTVSFGVVVSVLAGASQMASAQAHPTRQYLLEAGSSLRVERCLGPCDCALGPQTGAAYGSFDLRLVTPGDVFDIYEVSRVSIIAQVAGQTYQLSGAGFLRDATELAGVHIMELDLSIDGVEPVHFSSGFVTTVGRLHPYLDIAVATEVLGCHRYTIQIFSQAGCVADFDQNGRVDPDDLADFIAAYFSVEPPPRVDVDSNGVVNPDDLADFIARYFDGCE